MERFEWKVLEGCKAHPAWWSAAQDAGWTQGCIP